MTDLNDQVVLVTGANGGLGRRWVEHALRRGARKVYATDLTIRDWASDRVVALQLDVTNPVSISQAVAASQDVSILINNAGVPLRDPVVSLDVDRLRLVFEINFFGPLALTQQFAPVLKKNGGGAVVFVISVLSWIATVGGYSATKAALWAVANAFRVELLSQGTQVVAVHMGHVDTPMTVGLDVPKIDASDVVLATYDGLERGLDEILVDEASRQIKKALSEAPEALYPALQGRTRLT